MVLCALWLSAGFVLNAELVNGGFELVRPVEEKEGHRKNLESAEWKFDEPLVYPEGWRVANPGAFQKGEYRLVADPTQAQRGKNCVYIKGHFLHSGALDVTAGDELEISFYVKDPREKNAAGYLYFYYRDEQGKNRFTGSELFTVKTGTEWTRESGVIKIPEESCGNRVNSVIVALSSSTGAFFDDVEISHERTAKWLNFEDAFAEGGKKLKAGDYAGAREDFNAGLALTKEKSERIEALLMMAETHVREKNYAGAAQVFNAILAKENPDDNMKVDIYIKIADTCIMKRDYGKAVEVFAGILEMGEAGPITRVSTRFRMGDAYLRGGDKEKARETYAGVLDMPATTFVDKFDANKKIGDIYRSEKNYGKAREYYGKALDVADVNPYSEGHLLALIGDTYAAEEMYGEAREIYSKVFEIGLNGWTTIKPAYLKIADTYRKEKNFAKEREYYARMAKWADEEVSRIGQAAYRMAVHADMLRLTGDSYWEEGNKEKAGEYYLLFLERGRAKLEEKHVKEVESRVGKNKPAGYLRKADKHFFEREYEKARAEYGEVLKSGDSSLRQRAVACIKTGDSYLAQEDYKKAREEYLKVLGTKDVPAAEKIRAQMLIAGSYGIEQKYKQAREEYKKVFKLADAGSQQKIKAREKIAEMYRAEYNYVKARDEYGKILHMEGLSPVKREEIEERILSIYR